MLVLDALLPPTHTNNMPLQHHLPHHRIPVPHTQRHLRHLSPQMTLNNQFLGGRRQGWLPRFASGPWCWLLSGATITHQGTGLLCPAQPDCTFMSYGHKAQSRSARSILSAYAHRHTQAKAISHLEIRSKAPGNSEERDRGIQAQPPP